MDTNDFPRTDAGLIDPSFDDLYIKCSFGNQIYYYGKGKHRGEYTLVAYIPSLIHYKGNSRDRRRYYLLYRRN